MATIYYSRDSIINRNNSVDIWLDAFVEVDIAKERVNNLNNSRTEDDLEIGVEYHYLLTDWTKPSFYNE